MKLFTVFYTVTIKSTKQEFHRHFQFNALDLENATAYANTAIKSRAIKGLAGRKVAKWTCSTPTTEYTLNSFNTPVGWAFNPA